MVERDNIQCTVNQFDFTVFNRYTLIFTIRDSLIKHNIISTWLIIFAMEEDVYILGCKSINCESENCAISFNRSRLLETEKKRFSYCTN